MIPIIVITESGASFNYFEGRLIKTTINGLNIPDDEYGIEHELTGITGVLNGVDEIYERPFVLFKTSDPKLRDKVLELLHKEVADCFIYNINRTVQESTPLIQQYKFQIYLKDIIEKAKGETE